MKKIFQFSSLQLIRNYLFCIQCMRLNNTLYYWANADLVIDKWVRRTVENYTGGGKPQTYPCATLATINIKLTRDRTRVSEVTGGRLNATNREEPWLIATKSLFFFRRKLQKFMLFSFMYHQPVFRQKQPLWKQKGLQTPQRISWWLVTPRA